MNKTVGILAAAAVAAVMAVAVGYGSMFGYNEAGQRHFVQTWTGSKKTVTSGGPFWYGNGLKEPYFNALRSFYTPTDGTSCDYENKDGFLVQYGDGGKGSICAQLDTSLPFGDTFVALHEKYRSEIGIRKKLLDPNFRGLFTTTAELFTSTEAYETKRSQIAAALQDQLKNGAYVTTTKERDIVVGVDDTGTDITQVKSFSVIKLDENNKPMHQVNKFAAWDMTDIQVTVTGYDFEPKTMTQISNRRDATNRGETAQAEAKAAYWAGKKAEAEGETNRITAQARAEVNNATFIAAAKRDAELALIEATKVKDRAIEMTLAAVQATKQKKQEALQATEQAKVIITLAKANAYKIDAEQSAGELFKRIDAEVTKNKDLADAISKMNVPTQMTVLGGGSNKGKTAPMDMLLQLSVMDKLGKPTSK